MVLEKMIKEEFKENKLFKIPEEYGVFDDDEEYACKQFIEQKGLINKELGGGKELREKFKQQDGKDLYYEKQEAKSKKGGEKELEKFILSKVEEYLQMRKKMQQ